MRTVVALLVLLLPWGAFALPDQFFQEGLVTDDDGRPLQGEHRVRVRLFDVERGGAALFDEIHDGVPFVGGYYAIAVGSEAALDPALFRRGRLFMAVSIDNGPELEPRTPITKVPASFTADVATNATGDITPRTVSIPGFGMVIDQNGRWVGDPAGLGGGEPGDGEGDTPEQILAKLRTVDGSDSGLDADRLDGHDGNAFVRTADQVLERLRGVDGRGSGVDADRLDGLDSTAFVQTPEDVRDRLQEVDGAGSGVDADRLDGLDSTQFVRTAAQVRDLLRTVDGAGSAVDADRIDGLDSTAFMRADRDTGTAGSLTVRDALDVGEDGVVGGNLEVGALRVQGRVGIGVGDPGVALDVDGEIRSGALRVGHVQLAPRAAPPADPAEGMVYYDRARGVRAFDGQRWQPLSRGVVQGGDDACDAAMAGTIRWSGAAFEGCDGEDWTPFGQGGGGPVAGPGGDRATAGLHCLDLRQQGVAENGVYWIDPNGGDRGDAFQAYCDMLTEGGGWTLAARTVSAGLTPAQRDTIRRGNWATYTQTGYGDPDPASPIYWMPLNQWHTLTDRYPSNTLWSRTSRDSVRVRDFTVANGAALYAWNWSGTAAGHRSIIEEIRGARFTTVDRDNDTWGRNCSSENVGLNGGFWYTNCYQLSMLHANSNVYALFSNVDHRVDFNEIYLRPNPQPPRPDVMRRSCLQILQNDESEGSGRYWIDPNGGAEADAVLTWCDMETDGGGWTMMAKTERDALGNAERDMIRRGTWNDYAMAGYGSSAADAGAFWIPLEQWHALTTAHPNNVFWSQTNRADVKVSNLRVGNAAQAYAWNWDGTVAGNNGIIGNIRGARFTTHDRDNDTWGRNCARDNVGFNGGFWYTNCYQLSMLHADGRVYALYSNVDHSVSFNRLWIR